MCWQIENPHAILLAWLSEIISHEFLNRARHLLRNVPQLSVNQAMLTIRESVINRGRYPGAAGSWVSITDLATAPSGTPPRPFLLYPSPLPVLTRGLSSYTRCFTGSGIFPDGIWGKISLFYMSRFQMVLSGVKSICVQWLTPVLWTYITCKWSHVSQDFDIDWKDHMIGTSETKTPRLS